MATRHSFTFVGLKQDSFPIITRTPHWFPAVATITTRCHGNTHTGKLAKVIAYVEAAVAIVTVLVVYEVNLVCGGCRMSGTIPQRCSCISVAFCKHPIKAAGQHLIAILRRAKQVARSSTLCKSMCAWRSTPPPPSSYPCGDQRGCSCTADRCGRRRRESLACPGDPSARPPLAECHQGCNVASISHPWPGRRMTLALWSEGGG